MRSKTRDLISLITNNSESYDEKYTKIKFNSNDNFSLNKRLKHCNIIKDLFNHQGN